MNKKINKPIVILRQALKDGQISKELMSKDVALVTVINNHSKELKNKGIEIFKKEDNHIATEEGHYFAIWTKDLKRKFVKA